jgi:DNA segregation ATPase FtsK/SpoIIIE-like protein
LNDGQIQNPSKLFWIVPLSNFAPRGFGFVHHSIAILYHEVPNPNISIRNFFIAVSQEQYRSTAVPPRNAWPLWLLQQQQQQQPQQPQQQQQQQPQQPQQQQQQQQQQLPPAATQRFRSLAARLDAGLERRGQVCRVPTWWSRPAE